MASVFLYAPQSFHNLCLIARTLEAFGERACPVFDPNGLIRDHYGKVRTREMRAVSAGAFQKIAWQRIDHPEQFLTEHPGRVVATVAEATAIPLGMHRFERTDLVLFGSETLGLPAPVVAESAARITIPIRGVTRSLNLAVSLGIVLFERQRQIGTSA